MTQRVQQRCRARDHDQCVGGSPDGLTRRCRADDHNRCPGSWTSYPDHEGRCECRCHGPGDRADTNRATTEVDAARRCTAPIGAHQHSESCRVTPADAEADRNQPASAPRRHCAYCSRAIFKLRNGEWYHNGNASVSCRPGWSSTKATPR